MRFVPIKPVFTPKPVVDQDELKKDVVEDFKDRELIGVSDDRVNVDFSPGDGYDILVQKIDPEEALGYQLHGDESDYFQSVGVEGGADV